jgi:superfamily II RNA helicase
VPPPEGPGREPPREVPARKQRLIDRVPLGEIRSPEAILDRFLAWVRDTGLEPYPSQEEALLELMTGRHVVLSTPTGSGKSLVALGLHFKALCEGKRSFYTAPIKALVSEKFFDLCERFGAENVGMLTGDASINWAAPIVCCTAEVLANMAISQGEAADAPYVVMDEFHYYDDRDRGSAWQIPLIVLRHSQFLLLSATLGNTAPIEECIAARTGREVVHVHGSERPVPLDFEYAETPVHETIESLLERGRAPVYVVHFTQREAAEQAQALTSARILDRDARRAISVAVAEFRFDSPYGPTVRRVLSHGIGLHHAGLLPRYRRLVEKLAQDGLLRVICGTDTLGVGVNIPIRTVLFTRLCKFDGEKTVMLSVREFQQIAGRAGRRGFDVAGSVVTQAPEWVIENQRLEAKAGGRGGRGGRRKVVKRRPPEGMLTWTKKTFEERIWRAPEMLHSHFALDHGLVVGCLKGSLARETPGGGYRVLLDLIAYCHETDLRKRALRREAAALFRSLRTAGIVGVAPDERSGRPTVTVSEDLQRDFSLHQTLSLYLLDAVAALDPEAKDYALDVLSAVESILEDPRAILYAQQKLERARVGAELKAKGVPFDERREKLERVTWPKPNAEFAWATFKIFSEHHPWAKEEAIRPKSVARDMARAFMSFEDYVKACGIARVEGLLLRYLSQVHNTLVRNVPENARSDDVLDVIGYLRSLVAGVDSSLLQEWEGLVHPGSPRDSASAEAAPRIVVDPAADPRAFRARVRAEMHQLVRDLAAGHYEEAAHRVRQVPGDEWDAARLEAAIAPFYTDYQRILFDPPARQAHWTRIDPREPRLFDVHQVLLDDQGDNLWNVEAVVDLRDELPPESPWVAIRRIGT